MSPASSRAKYLRGALVGLCSAVTSAVAHGVAGGELPSGGSVILMALACSVAGGLAGTVGSRCGATPGAVLAWLVAAQLAGHLTLVGTGCYGHDGGGPAMSPTMLAAHCVGALVCAMLIAAAERLYVVCESVLSWLTVFFARLVQPGQAPDPGWVNPPALQAILLVSGGGTRGPPRFVAAFT
jgi:hypothetical protein